MKNELITVPTFEYKQGTHKDDNFQENPIRVEYYDGSICLKQEGHFTEDETILISPEHLDSLFKAIKKNLTDAKVFLKR